MTFFKNNRKKTRNCNWEQCFSWIMSNVENFLSAYISSVYHDTHSLENGKKVKEESARYFLTHLKCTVFVYFPQILTMLNLTVKSTVCRISFFFSTILTELYKPSVFWENVNKKRVLTKKKVWGKTGYSMNWFGRKNYLIS